MEKQKFIVIISTVLISFCFSCNHKVNNKDSRDSRETISQQEDGSILLKLEEAICYNDQTNPSSNTAEWKFVVPKPGRYNVWLSSATRDTNNLDYSKPVKISLLDNHLERNPECDKIIRNSSDVTYPFFRTDSYMGSFYIQESGEYNIQVISEKVTTKEIRNQSQLIALNTRLMSIILIPMTR
jgi:hypothetical protein